MDWLQLKAMLDIVVPLIVAIVLGIVLWVTHK
jgi:hypothetical protein